MEKNYLAADPALMSQKKMISLFFLLLGLSLLYAGVQEYRILSSSYNTLFSISPANETRAIIIIGVAISISGFVGLLRDKVI